MSFFELIVIFLVSVLLIRPKDLPVIISKLRKFRKTVEKTKEEILSSVKINEIEGEIISENRDEINQYLKKIADLGGSYEGEYDLEQIRACHKKLSKKHLR